MSTLSPVLPAYKADFLAAYLPKTNPNTLSLSGGGVRGIITLTILEELEKRIEAKIGEVFELGTATSVGSLIWAALCLRDEKDPEQTKYSVRQLKPIFENKLQTIFSNTFLHEISSGYGLMAPKYKSDGISQVLDEIFGTTLAKDLKGEFCFPAFNVGNFQTSAFHFTSAAARLNPSWRTLTVKDMLLSTTAAPSYFEPHQIALGENKFTLVDGGLTENNPSPRAYALTKQLFSCGENMTLLSLGTGVVNYAIHGNMSWGEAQWAPWMLPAFFGGQDSTASTLVEDLLPDSSFTIQLTLSEGHDSLDDASPANLAYLENVAHTWLEDEKNNEKFEALCARLIKSTPAKCVLS